VKFFPLQTAARLQEQTLMGQSLGTGGRLLVFEVEKDYFLG